MCVCVPVYVLHEGINSIADKQTLLQTWFVYPNARVHKHIHTHMWKTKSCIYIYAFVCIHVFVCVYIHVFLKLFRSIHTYINLWVFIYVSICLCVCVYSVWACVCVYFALCGRVVWLCGLRRLLLNQMVSLSHSLFDTLVKHFLPKLFGWIVLSVTERSLFFSHPPPIPSQSGRQYLCQNVQEKSMTLKLIISKCYIVFFFVAYFLISFFVFFFYLWKSQRVYVMMDHWVHGN